MKPKRPELCNVYSIRKSTFHLHVIKCEFTKQLIEYKLLELLIILHFINFIQSSYTLFHWI